jgi:hypothetical protein
MLKVTFAAIVAILANTIWFSAAVAQTPPSSSKSSLPDIASDQVFSGNHQHVLTIQPEQLGKNLLNIYQQESAKNIFYYLPYAYVDWKAVSDSVNEQCQENAKKTENIKIILQFYWPELMDEIRISIAKGMNRPTGDFSVTVPQNAGLVAFVHDKEGNPFGAIDTIPPVKILKGAPVASIDAGFPAEISGTINATCSDLRVIAERRQLTTLMFASGRKADVNQVTAAAGVLLNSKFVSDLKNAESQVKKTTISSSAGGSNLSFKAGPFGFGRGFPELKHCYGRRTLSHCEPNLV